MDGQSRKGMTDKKVADTYRTRGGTQQGYERRGRDRKALQKITYHKWLYHMRQSKKSHVICAIYG
jgi:hypothetical protein